MKSIVRLITGWRDEEGLMPVVLRLGPLKIACLSVGILVTKDCWPLKLFYA